MAPTAATTITLDAVSGRDRARVGGPPRAWGLPHHPGSVSAARRVTRTALRAWGLDEAITDEALIVVSELVTNAVEHALPPVALRLERRTADTVRIEVVDGGPTGAVGAWCAGRGPEEGGRGGDIIDVLASAHGSHRLPSGATHWADLTVVR